MSKHIHIHTAALLRPKTSFQSGTKDFDFNKAPFWLLKQDTEFPARLGWRKSNMANGNFYVPSSTVFYEVAPGKFVPHFAKSGTPFAMNKSDFMRVDRGNGKDAGEITYFKGNKASYTGKKEELYGRTAYEIKILEGPEKGKTKVTYREPGKIGPANLDSKDESAETKARHEGKLSETAEKQISYAGSPKRADMPSGVFLKSSNKTYPVKKKVNGEWKYDKNLLLAAARRARMEGDESLANKADSIREKMEKNED